MIISDDIRCVYCSRIFCCKNCKLLHEQRNHAVSDVQTIQNSCFICHGKSFPLQKTGFSQLLMDHIVQKHLPLYCKKCTKVYNSANDFDDIEKCTGVKHECISSTISNACENNSPVLDRGKENSIEELDEKSPLTPLTKFNLKWRRKSASLTGSMSDSSVSGINHSTNSSAKTSPTSVKLVRRTTSTPMTRMFLSKPHSLDSLCSSSYQASSIEHITGHEIDKSASILSNAYESPPPNVLTQHQSPPRRHARRLLPKAHTPLRQVMSKSIQRAIQEHNNQREDLRYNKKNQRKILLDTTADMSDIHSPKPLPGVLDLRTTPVLKRTYSEPYPRTRTGNIVRPTIVKVPPSEESKQPDAPIIQPESPKASNPVCDNAINETLNNLVESIMPPATSKQTSVHAENSEVFLSCDSINATAAAFTPKPSSNVKQALVTPMQSTFYRPPNPYRTDSSDKEIWYTPKSISVRKQKEVSDDESDTENDAVFKEDPCKKSPQSGRIWRIVSSVIRLASAGFQYENPNGDGGGAKEIEQPKNSLVQRTLSLIRPSIKRSPIKRFDTSSVKRKRNISSPSSQSEDSPIVPELRSPVAKKYKTITGRKPIQRLRSSVIIR